MNERDDNVDLDRDAGGSPVDAAERQLASDLEEARDRLLRVTAELDNYRKRAARELQDERRYAVLPLVRDLMPLIDNVQRAVEAAEKAAAPPAMQEGVRLLAQQLETILSRHDCKKIEALGQPFDPHIHEAISHLPSKEYPANTVAAVAATGYQLHDRVVRPAQVVVSSGPG